MEKCENQTADLSLGLLLRSLLKGVGQVMFQSHTLCGFLFLVGIFWGAILEARIEVAWGGLVGLTTATLSGCILSLKTTDGREGLWGFNGILVGCALMTFLGESPFTWVVLILASAMSVWVREGLNRVMSPARINSLTIPFVLTTWLFLLAARAMNHLPIEALEAPGFPPPVHPYLHTDLPHLVDYWLKGVAQVFLLNSWPTGLLFLIGLALSNGWSAFWGGFASALSLALAILFGCGGEAISEGLYGFSPVLTGVALGSIFYRPSWRSSVWCLVGIVVTLFAQAALNVLLAPVGLPALTAPFCLVTWIFLLPMLPLEPRDVRQSAFLLLIDHRDWHSDHKFHLNRGRTTRSLE